MDVGTIAQIWRYPVKSLRAEALQRVAIEHDGLAGDRTAALLVETPEHARAGKPFRGKESPRLHLTRDVAAAVGYAADANVRIALSHDVPRWFDARPVSVLLDLWVRDVEALVGETLDPLRWRPNLYVTAAPGFATREAGMIGMTLHTGGAVLRVVSTIKRCVTTTYDVQTGASEPRVLGEVARERDNTVGIYCEVVTSGEAGIGDAIAAA